MVDKTQIIDCYEKPRQSFLGLKKFINKFPEFLSRKRVTPEFVKSQST